VVEEEVTRKGLRRRIPAIVAVVVALALGAAVGVYVEHDKAKDESNEASPVSTTSTWFGDQTKAACPGIQQWNTALGKAVYVVLVKGQSWESTRTALLPLMVQIESAYSRLLPDANAAGGAELQFLLASAVRSRSLIQQSASAEAYFSQNTPPQESARLKADFDVMLKAASSCSTG
jgi:hypothetical protein